MKVYFTFSKVYALVLCLFLLIAFCLLGIISNGRSDITLENEAQRTAFLNRCGFGVGDPMSVKTVTVPLKFDEEYRRFNHILKEGGYSFEEYKGKALTEYTYYAEKGLIIHIFTDEEKLAGAICLDLQKGNIYPLAGEKSGTDKAG